MQVSGKKVHEGHRGSTRCRYSRTKPLRPSPGRYTRYGIRDTDRPVVDRSGFCLLFRLPYTTESYPHNRRAPSTYSSCSATLFLLGLLKIVSSTHTLTSFKRLCSVRGILCRLDQCSSRGFISYFQWHSFIDGLRIAECHLTRSGRLISSPTDTFRLSEHAVLRSLLSLSYSDPMIVLNSSMDPSHATAGLFG